MPKTLKQQIMGKCRHFNGTQHGTCEAGVSYDSVRSDDRRGMPCFFDSTMSGGKECEKCEKVSEEEADAEVAEIKASFEKTATARAAIVAHLGGPWKKGAATARGSIECPCCKGTLQFSRAGYNGHIHAQCETKDCVAWME